MRQTSTTRLRSSNGVSAAHHPPTETLPAAGGGTERSGEAGGRLPESIQRILWIDAELGKNLLQCIDESIFLPTSRCFSKKHWFDDQLTNSINRHVKILITYFTDTLIIKCTLCTSIWQVRVCTGVRVGSDVSTKVESDLRTLSLASCSASWQRWSSSSMLCFSFDNCCTWTSRCGVCGGGASPAGDTPSLGIKGGGGRRFWELMEEEEESGWHHRNITWS